MIVCMDFRLRGNDDRMDVSIIIVNYNTKDLTLDCIDSVLAEGSKLKKEIIVIDNASTDGSLDALSKLEKNAVIHLIKNTENAGFAKANNQGINIAIAPYIFLLNSDTKVKKYAIEKLLTFAKNNENVGAVGSKLLNADGTVQSSAFPLPTIARAIQQYWLGQKGTLDKYAPKGMKPAEVEVLVMAAFLITPKTLKKVGLLNEKYFMYFEDFDYCRSIIKSGLKIYYLPTSEVIHYHGASGKKIADSGNQWRRLIPSSKIYHGLLKHELFTFILWSGQKLQKFLTK
jgi:GT2 family glycosyltransferase